MATTNVTTPRPAPPTAPALNIHGPPVGTVPLTDEAWRRWFTDIVWPVIGAGVGQSGVQGTFPQLQVGRASFTNENSFQELLNLNQGLYVTYFTTAQNIVYGFACNVHRAAGAQFTVGAQINAWGEVGSTGDVFGIASTALAQPLSGTRNLICEEPDIANLCSSSLGAKWGINPVFKDRGDGAATPGEGGIGSNLYNYFSCGMVFTSQARTASGEFCGWNVGIQYLGGSVDAAKPPAWSATVTYQPGQCVLSGGFVWKAIVSNLNVAPVAGATWVQYSLTSTLYAVGIDFSCVDTTTMARMWSAIRLRNTMAVHWEETGAIATYMDSANSRHVLSANYNVGLGVYTRNLQVDVTNGNLWVANGITGLGGGAAPTFGTIGGSGPTAAAQRGWYKIIDSTTGNPFWVPVWQ